MPEKPAEKTEERIINPFLKRTSYLGDYEPKNQPVFAALFGADKKVQIVEEEKGPVQQ